MFEIVKRRYWYFGLSLLVIMPGLIALGLWGLPLAIDFTGGTLLELQFAQTTRPVDIAQVRQVYAGTGHPDSTVQLSGTDIVVVRSKTLTQADQQSIIAALSELYGPASVLSAEMVGPSVGAEVATRATGAVGLAAGVTRLQALDRVLPALRAAAAVEGPLTTEELSRYAARDLLGRSTLAAIRVDTAGQLRAAGPLPMLAPRAGSIFDLTRSRR